MTFGAIIVTGALIASQLVYTSPITTVLTIVAMIATIGLIVKNWKAGETK